VVFVDIVSPAEILPTEPINFFNHIPLVKSNLNIFTMLRPGFQNDFAIAFRKAIANKEAELLHHVKIGTNAGALALMVNIQWIHNPEPLFGKLMIIFTDVPEPVSTKPLKKKNKKRQAVSGKQNLRKRCNIPVRRCKTLWNKCKLRRKS